MLYPLFLIPETLFHSLYYLFLLPEQSFHSLTFLSISKDITPLSITSFDRKNPHSFPVHCPKSNPKFRDISRNGEENETLNEVFHVVSRFPCYISCYIAENRLPLGQCTVSIPLVLKFFRNTGSYVRETVILIFQLYQ